MSEDFELFENFRKLSEDLSMEYFLNILHV